MDADERAFRAMAAQLLNVTYESMNACMNATKDGIEIMEAIKMNSTDPAARQRAGDAKIIIDEMISYDHQILGSFAQFLPTIGPEPTNIINKVTRALEQLENSKKTLEEKYSK